jgi:hypothetical protein
LIALVGVRTTLFERGTGVRPDGAIAAIRRRNASLRAIGGAGGGLPGPEVER